MIMSPSLGGPNKMLVGVFDGTVGSEASDFVSLFGQGEGGWGWGEGGRGVAEGEGSGGERGKEKKRLKSTHSLSSRPASYDITQRNLTQHNVI